ncbi:hypothetical protein Glove_465g46 [Diversispora epigaea]|uniref:Uncharacterized protein n=1 Tax=Diversispora epigaea TaxID=1348612 RepID=A0A397GSP4_9GLOM|nr:hypothetical protein Glove_465g46 [Diversispora epigaea]
MTRKNLMESIDSIIISDDENLDNDYTIVESKEDELEPNTDESINQWKLIIFQWVNKCIYENCVENKYDEISIGTHDIHPADD